MGNKSNPKGLRLNLLSPFFDNNKKGDLISSWSFLWYQDVKFFYVNLFMLDYQISLYLDGVFKNLETFGEVVFMRRNFELDLQVKMFSFKQLMFTNAFIFSYLSVQILNLYCRFCNQLFLSQNRSELFSVNFFFNIEQFFYPESLFQFDHAFLNRKSTIVHEMYTNVVYPFSVASLFARYISANFSDVVNVNFFSLFDLNFLLKRYPTLKGVRLKCSGRIQGSEIARSEIISYGSIPLNRLNARVDYGFSSTVTAHGVLGVSVWLYF